MPVKNIRRSQAGISLVEMMVASTIGLMITAVILGLFLSTKSAYLTTETRNNLFANGRYAIGLLNDELLHASFWGDTHASDIFLRADLDPIASDCTGNAGGYAVAVGFSVFTTTAANIVGCIDDAKPGTDVIIVKRVANAPAIVANNDPARTYLMGNAAIGILYDGADAPPSTALGGDVPGGVNWEYLATIYYIRETSGNPPGLYRKRLYGNTWGASEEVANGIESMKLLIGIDTNSDGSANTFVNANDVSDWSKAVASRLYLLAQSETADNFYTNENVYVLGNTTIDPTPNDHYRRLVLETTTSFRNQRLLVVGGF